MIKEVNLVEAITIERIVKSIVVESITTTADDKGNIKKTKLQMLEEEKGERERKKSKAPSKNGYKHQWLRSVAQLRKKTHTLSHTKAILHLHK